MLRITHMRGRRAPAVEQFVHSPVRIGCAQGSDVLLPHGDGAVIMPHHAEIRREGGGDWLVDLGTPSGTFVGGIRVTRHPLRSGDVISLGGPFGPAFRVEIQPAAAAHGAGGAGSPAHAQGQFGAGGAADADGRVDVETAQRMVQAAVLQAVQREDKAVAIVRTKAAEAKRRAARHNLLLGVGAALALLAVGFAAVATYRSRRAADVLAVEAGLGDVPAIRPSGAIPTQVLTGREIFEQNKGALYVMGYLLKDRVGGCCSAFAIGPNLLATNAHCVTACGARGGTPIVTPNESGGKTRFKIVAMARHPAYQTDSQRADSPDVALLRIDGRAPKAVTLASDAELWAIGPGDDAYVIGFPGRLMDPLSPSATFLQGRIGRVTGLGERAATPARAVLLQHDAVTRGGNSGSPIFNQHGHVIGIHAAHIDEEDDIAIDGRKTKVLRSSPFRLGMRIDLLKGVPAP